MNGKQSMVIRSQKLMIYLKLLMQTEGIPACAAA